ncbi:uncharacterized protein LOC143147644 [Ptiloglossa arizonensis]|uniref:uncharacterized protein LOC143147644 n=1 Tax=Ptiloglossa arizonensis TaxID=3350558 RepID=UPI003F9F501E
MPYYGDGLPYYYGGTYANHSSLMTGTPRTFHTPLSRFSPHLSTISESPLSTLRRYSPVSVPARPRRVIDTADIDVSTPRILSGDGNHQRNRLRRDRPTIKIRSQALKDNPALREHNERHEKSVGELLVEKFLIKDKKLEETEPQLQLYHQVSLEKDDDLELQQAKKITRRLTRRRSSADIQLDPEQLEREVAYAQVQAKVLDTLVAEEQAEIENEVRRGTLIKKGAVGGPRGVAGFFRAQDGESQEEEEAAVQKMRKSLKKVKKKKRVTERPSPTDDDENDRERRSSTSSDVSVDLQRDEKADRKHTKQQMFKIEASNSVGDFSTVWVGSGTPNPPGTIEQFRESVKVPAPRKMGIRKIDRDSVGEESETEVVLPVKRPYVKDTSRNSVYVTVRTPPETVKTDPLKKLETIANGVGPRNKEDTSLKNGMDRIFSDLDDEKLDTVIPENPTVKDNGLPKSKKEAQRSPEILKANKIGAQDKGTSNFSKTASALKKEVNKEDTSKILKTEKEKGVSNVSKTASALKKVTIDANPEILKTENTVQGVPNISKTTSALKKVTIDANPEILKTENTLQGVSNVSKTASALKKVTIDANPEILKTENTLQGVPNISKTTSALKKVTIDANPEILKTENTVQRVSNISKTAPGSKKVTIDDTPEIFQTEVTAQVASNVSKSGTKKEPIEDESPEIAKSNKNELAEKVVDSSTRRAPSVPKKEEPQRRPEPPIPRKLGVTGREEPPSTKGTLDASCAMLAVDPLARENSANGALPSGAYQLPKPSKINTDENNAVEAPKRALRDAEYLANTTKIERDDDVGCSLPGKKTNKAVTLTNASTTRVSGGPSDGGALAAGFPTSENRSGESVADDAIVSSKLVTQSTLSKAFKCETPSTEDSVKATENLDKVNRAKEPSVEKLTRRVDEESKFPYKVQKSEIEKAEVKPGSKDTSGIEPVKDSRIPWRNKVSKIGTPNETGVQIDRSISVDSCRAEVPDQKSLKQSVSLDETRSGKMPLDKQQQQPMKSYENGESGTLSKSTSTESIDFWSEIRGPESPNVTKQTAKGFNYASSKSSEQPRRPVEDPAVKELDKKKETDPKISVAAAYTPAHGLGNITVIEEERGAEKGSSTVDETTPGVKETAPMTPESETVPSTPKKGPKKRKNLSIAIAEAQNDAFSTVKKTPLKREDSSSASSVSARSMASTPDTAVPSSQVTTPVYDVSVPIINVIAATAPSRSDSQILDDDEDPKTPTNESWPETGLSKIAKWNNQNDLTNVDETDKDVTPVPSKDVSATVSPESSPESSKKKKVVRKKKSSTTKKASNGKDNTGKESKESKKNSTKLIQETLKPPEPKIASKASPKTTPTQRPIDLIRMFYTTPTALLTATPRDLSKVRRAKIKRRKHHSRTPSVSSDSTGSTTSTATTESTDGSRSTCTELDDDPDKRMNSTRSNDSGFDGSPRISTPSQSSDTQRNSDSSDHFPSGRITPPATNLPRFKKYAVTDFNFLKVLGKGSFGKVLLAELRGTECVYAVKCLKKDVVLEDDDVECTLIERKVLTLATRHPYLCHLFCTFQTDSHLFFVMEYLNGGDLMFHIQKSGRFSEPRARFYAAEIWSGLNFLHKKGIVYRDLKLDNVLLDFEGHIRIADFGMCKLQIFLDRTADTFCGTPDYMAPEIIKGLKYNQAVDWWSYGVLLYEMLTGQSPFSGCDEDELFWSICNERPFIPRYLSQDATDMLICLLEKDSGKRLPGHEIALHSFFQSLPWDRLERRQLEAPFKPALEHTLDTKYFDTAFTAERPRLTPVPEQILTSIDQGVFRGFSYTNPNATD